MSAVWVESEEAEEVEDAELWARVTVKDIRIATAVKIRYLVISGVFLW